MARNSSTVSENRASRLPVSKVYDGHVSAAPDATAAWAHIVNVAQSAHETLFARPRALVHCNVLLEQPHRERDLGRERTRPQVTVLQERRVTTT